MFNIPYGKESLIEDYKKLVFEGLKLKYIGASDDECDEMLIYELEPKNLEEMSLTIEDEFLTELFFDSNSNDDVRSFVEDRIGEDFLVFEGFEDYVFCIHAVDDFLTCLLYTSPSPRDQRGSRMPSSA